MAKPSFEPAKGTRDWYGQDTLVRNHIRDTLREIFERYGYDRLETPPIETRAALGFKGGGEIQKEVFRLHDQGGRDLALRFDQTVPLARYIGSSPELKFPFKRYVIGEVFRDGPTQPEQGRYRVFTQCDVDVLGIKEMTAEAELFALAQDAFQAFGLGGVDVTINNKKLLDGILDYAGVQEVARQRAIVALDKMDKIGVEGVRSELEQLTLFPEVKQMSNDTLKKLVTAYDSKGVVAIDDAEVRRELTGQLGVYGYEQLKTLVQGSSGLSRAELIGRIGEFETQGELLLSSDSISRIMSTVSKEGDNDTLFSYLTGIVSSDRGKEGLEEIRQLLDFSRQLGMKVRLNPVLARGLDYYTGTTIEVYLKDRSIVPSAILAGGRFDDMVGDFKGTGEEIPAVGFSFGLERMAMILSGQRKFPQTVRQVYVVPIGNSIGACLKIAHDLRNQGINIDMELRHGVKPGKATSYASASGIPYVAFVGQEEVDTNTITLKNLESGKQERVPIDSVKEKLGNKL